MLYLKLSGHFKYLLITPKDKKTFSHFCYTSLYIALLIAKLIALPVMHTPDIVQSLSGKKKD
jgi:hypothetical protein